MNAHMYVCGGYVVHCQVLVFDSDGTNLRDVLTNPRVDHTRTASNDVIEILSVRVPVHVCTNVCGLR